MTSPTQPATGHPDWQTIVATQTGNLFPSLQPNLPAGITSTPFFATGSYGSVQALIVASTGQGQLTMETSVDGTPGAVFAQDTLLLRDGNVVQPRFPVRGPFMRLRINNTSVGVQTFLTWAQLCSTATPTMTFPITSAIAGENNRALAASAALTYNLIVMKPGLANIMLNPHDQLAKLDLVVFTTDEAGNPVLDVAHFPPQAGPINQQLVLPARPVSMTVTNTDAGAPHTYDVSLICPPSVG
jgi:hypothetical protein